LFTAESIWGLDVGDSGIKAVRLSLSKGQVSVDDYSRVELDEKVKKSDGYMAAVAKALGKLTDKKDFSKTEVCISISAKNANSQFISMDADLKDKEFQKDIVDEAERQIPFPLDEVEWRYHRMGEGDDDVQVALFAARSDHIQNLLDVMGEAGLDVRGIQVPGMALYNLISELYDDDLVVLDFGEKSTGLLVSHEDQFWLRSLPLSGSHITTLLEKKFRITNSEAQTLKNEMENSPQRDKLFRVIEPKLKELIIEIKRSINFRKTQMKDLNPKKFLAWGGSSMLPGVTDFFAQHLGYEMCEPNFGDMDFSECKKSSQLKAEFPSYAVAFGLALQGLGLGETKVNLAPAAHIKKQVLKDKRWSLLIANAALLALAVVTSMGNASLEDFLKSGEKRLGQAKQILSKEISRFSTHEKKVNPLMAELEELSKVLSGDLMVPKIYRQVRSVLDRFDGVYVTSMSLSEMKPEHFMAPVEERKVKKSSSSRSQTNEVSTPVMLNMTFVGGSAKVNTEITGALMKLPLFAVKTGGKQPEIAGLQKQFTWSYTPKVQIRGEDIFANDPPVNEMREKMEWVFSQEGEKRTQDLVKNVQTLKVQVQLGALFSSEGDEA
jgi:type IV pilus assembly protein PilM